MALSIWYILRSSCCKVLAAKYKLKTVRATLLRFGSSLQKEGTKSLPSLKDPLIRGALFKTGRDRFSRVGSIFRRASLTIRVADISCCKCGSTLNVEMHHIRALKNRNKRLDPVSMAMSARSRKQIPLCRKCHVRQHVNFSKTVS